MNLQELENKIEDNRRTFREAVDRLRADNALSPEGKRMHLTEAYTAAADAHQKLRDQYVELEEKASQARIDSAFKPSFTIAATDSERVATMASYRGALDRAAAAESSPELSRLLDQALLVGDSLQVKAVGLEAYRRSEDAILQKIADTDRNVRELIDGKMGFDMRFRRSAVLSAPAQPKEVSQSDIANHDRQSAD